MPVVDHWWQTETGWPIVANLRGLEPMPIKAGSPTVPVPGFDVQVLDETGQRVAAGVEGAICIRLPMPPGTLPTLWQDDERYVASYLSAYPGFYLSGDGGYVDEDGYVFVMGRTDDVLNVAGHRLSTGSLEAALAGHPAVAECAVIGVYDELKGQVPRGLVVLKAGVEADPETLQAELVQRVRDEVGAVASLRRVDIVPALPKTRSGKVLRKTMRELADGQDPLVPSTIEDAGVLDRAPARPSSVTSTASTHCNHCLAESDGDDAQAGDGVRDPRASLSGSSAAGTLRAWPKRLPAPVAEPQRTWRGRSRSPRSPSST